MKIIHIIEPAGGGAYDFIINLINCSNENDEFIIIHGFRDCNSKDFIKDFHKKVKFINWRNVVRDINIIKDIYALIEIIRILKSIINIDIIHLHSSKAGFLGRVAARILGLQDKVVYTSHGVSFLRKDVSKFKIIQYIYFEKIASYFGGKVVACSKSESIEFKKMGIKADFIFNGIDDCKQSNSIDIKIPFNKKVNEILIGTIGRITIQKNPSLFREIAIRYKDIDNIKFIWIGDGELKEAILSSNVYITGWLCKKEVIKYLDYVDIYISTSWWEGLPLSVLQAMCKGKPLILSSCVGNSDLALNGYNGFLYSNMEDAITQIDSLINNKGKRYFLGNNSRKLFMNKFNLSKMVKNYYEIYSKIRLKTKQ